MGTIEQEVKRTVSPITRITQVASGMPQVRAQTEAPVQITTATSRLAPIERVSAVAAVFSPSRARRWTPGPSAFRVK